MTSANEGFLPLGAHPVRRCFAVPVRGRILRHLVQGRCMAWSWRRVARKGLQPTPRTSMRKESGEQGLCKTTFAISLASGVS